MQITQHISFCSISLCNELYILSDALIHYASLVPNISDNPLALIKELLDQAKKYQITANTLGKSIKYVSTQSEPLKQKLEDNYKLLAEIKDKFEQLALVDMEKQKLIEQYNETYDEEYEKALIAQLQDEPIKSSKPKMKSVFYPATANSSESEDEVIDHFINPQSPPVSSPPFNSFEVEKFISDAKKRGEVGYVKQLIDLAEHYSSQAKKCWPYKVAECIDYLEKAHGHLVEACGIIKTYPQEFIQHEAGASVVLFNIIKKLSIYQQVMDKKLAIADRARNEAMKAMGPKRIKNEPFDYEKLSQPAKNRMELEIRCFGLESLQHKVKKLVDVMTYENEPDQEKVSSSQPQGIFLGTSFFKAQKKPNKKMESRLQDPLPETVEKKFEYEIYPPEDKKLTSSCSEDSIFDKTDKKCRYVFYSNNSQKKVELETASVSRDLRNSL